MSLEAIKQITETEQSIQTRRAAAEAEARQITADAEKAGQALIKQARTEAAEQPFFGLILSGFLLAVLRAVEAALRHAIHRRKQAETVGKEAEA